jgi:hypothetical protein
MLHETDKVPGMKDVHDNFDRARKKAGIKRWKAKFVKRKYAFGEVDVPKEASWLKVVYGSNGQHSFFSHRPELLISTTIYSPTA